MLLWLQRSMSTESITYFNRYSGQRESEAIYGEAYLRWAYSNPLGRLCLHLLVKRALFSRWYGWRMDRPASRNKILPFIQRYGLNPNEFAQAPDRFANFNEFFYRKLRPETRPVDPDEQTAVFPADGRHLGFQDLSVLQGIFVKGEVFELSELLAEAELAERFREGVLVCSRLCPTDYHRFHFPVAGLADRPRVIPGPLYSVSPIALRRDIGILARNKRAMCRIESPRFGLVLMLEIGATNVGSFRYTFTPGQAVLKGAEKGYFAFGGSSIITLFEKGRIRLAADLVEQSAQGMELYAHVGDALGRASD